MALRILAICLFAAQWSAAAPSGAATRPRKIITKHYHKGISIVVRNQQDKESGRRYPVLEETIGRSSGGGRSR